MPTGRIYTWCRRCLSKEDVVFSLRILVDEGRCARNRFRAPDFDVIGFEVLTKYPRMLLGSIIFAAIRYVKVSSSQRE